MASDGLEERQRRAAQNQSLFRQINERLEGLNESFATVLPEAQFVCECARVDCLEQITMTIEEYEALRRIPSRFAVVPGHVFAEVERVVDSGARFQVVEKFGAGGVEAVASDPRAERAI